MKNSVLIVNDTAEEREAISHLLSQSGYHIITAEDGCEGIEKAQQEHPDVIISAVQMPRMDGITMCRLIRANPKLRLIPILLVSAPSHDSKSLIDGLQAGAEDYLEIPHDPILLVTKVARLVERKRTEEALHQSQKHLSGIINSGMDAIITVDGDQRIILFNSAAEKLFGWPAEAIIGQPLDRIIPERFRVRHKEYIQDFGRTNMTKRSMGLLNPIFGLRADGEEFPMEAAILQVESEGQKLYTVIMRDITERNRLEEALKRQADALREQTQILDLAHILILNLNDQIILWNSGMEQLYGWSREEALHVVSYLLLKTEYPQSLESIKKSLLEKGHWEGELVHTKKDGRKVIVVSHWVLHRDEHGEPRAILEVNNDITERKQAEKEVRRLNEELEQRVSERTAQLQAANKELEAFSYSVSHDLRAPLRHINGFSQALLEDYSDRLDEEGRFYLQEVRAASREMAQLIDDLLKLARVTRSGMRRETVNLSELALEVINDLQKGEVGRTVGVKVEAGLLAHCDKRLMHIMFSNLLGNAWKFTSKREQAEISFGQEHQNGQAVYFVRDNGAGFDMAYVNKLFGAFQRLHSASEFEGTGIGLATIQRIVRRHGGLIRAEGKVNQGATFYFTLPNFKEAEHGEQSDFTG